MADHTAACARRQALGGTVVQICLVPDQQVGVWEDWACFPHGQSHSSSRHLPGLCPKGQTACKLAWPDFYQGCICDLTQTSNNKEPLTHESQSSPACKLYWATLVPPILPFHLPFFLPFSFLLSFSFFSFSLGPLPFLSFPLPFPLPWLFLLMLEIKFRDPYAKILSL